MVSLQDIRRHLTVVRTYQRHIEQILTCLLYDLPWSPIAPIAASILPVLCKRHRLVPVKITDMRPFKTPVHKILRLPHDWSTTLFETLVEIRRCIHIIGISELRYRPVSQMIGNQGIKLMNGQQRVEHRLVNTEGRTMTDALRHLKLIRHILPRLSMIKAAHHPIAMVTIHIKIDVKRITHKQRCRTLTPDILR